MTAHDTRDKLRLAIRDIPDFPKAGIVFKDITPLLSDGPLFRETILEMRRSVEHLRPTHVVGLESRGFIFGSALATELGIGFVPARKPGKLPFRTTAVSYGLEYGTDTLELHVDAFPTTARVLVVDDVIATGGTALAAIGLVRNLGVEPVGFLALMDLSFLPGRALVEAQVPVFSLLTF